MKSARRERGSGGKAFEMTDQEKYLPDTEAVQQAMQSALIETNGGFTGRELIGELGDVARRLTSALQDRGVELVIRNQA